jgi:DNA (cytosine-5)-methyltransferase 1
VTAEKPPYRIPLIAEIRKVKLNGLTVASTFSGCGGSCLGFRWAGFKHVYANEFIPAARETYLANFPGAKYLDDRDIRLAQVEDVLKASGMKPGELDVFEGSPPCSSFSSAGKGAKGWGEVKKYSDSKQRTDDLFHEYIRLLKGLQPRMFVAENVAGLVRGAAIGYFLEIMEAMKAAGYVVECRILDAQWLGVPQVRRRTIFVGVRRDLADAGMKFTYPSPLPYCYSIADALPHAAGVMDDTSGQFSLGELPMDAPANTLTTKQHLKIRSRKFGGGEVEIDSAEPIPTIMAHGVGGVAAHQVSIEKYAIGKEWKSLKPGESSDKYLNLIRPHKDKSCPTITQTGGTMGAASVTHPSEPRKFTIAELRRLSGFPDDFILTGSFQQQWERIGRAVPPPMMMAVAREVAKALKGAK